MMSFSTREILLSLLYSAIYGAVYFAFYTSICVVKNGFALLRCVPQSIIRYDKILDNPIKKQGRITTESSAFAVAASVILFMVGLIFLYYYALDGCVRLYAFLVSLSSFLLLKRLIFWRCFAWFRGLQSFLIYLVIVLFRMLLFPFLRLFLHFKRKKWRFLPIFNKNNI